jgi:hypothetical protein
MTATSATLHTLSTVSLVGVFFFVLFSRLRAAQYGVTSSVLLTTLCIAQPAYVYSSTGFGSIVLAISVYAMCAAAMAFAQRQDPRRIVLLGGSLATAQLINPLCGAAASIALPVTLHRSIAGGNIRSTLGVVVSVLFIPALVSIGSLYLLVQNASLLRWPASTIFSGRELMLASIGAILGIVPLFIALRLRPAACVIVVGVLATIVAAGSLASAVLSGREYVLQSSAAAGGLLLYHVSDWVADGNRVGLAVSAAISNFAVACFLAFALVRLRHG